MCREQVVTIVDLVDVDLAKFLKVFEHSVGETHTFARILERLAMVLVLRQNRAQLQLQLALLVDSSVPHRDLVTLVELRVADESNRLLQIKDALLKHADPSETQGKG